MSERGDCGRLYVGTLHDEDRREIVLEEPWRPLVMLHQDAPGTDSWSTREGVEFLSLMPECGQLLAYVRLSPVDGIGDDVWVDLRRP